MKYPVHPGRIIKSDMEALGMDVTETAQRLGVSTEQLKSVIDGQESVSSAMAVELDKLFGGGPSIWHRLQTRYDEARERNKDEVPEELDTLPIYTQTATVPLDHGRLVYTTYDQEVIAFRTEFPDSPGPSDKSRRHRLEFRFVGEGPGAVRVQLIYQPASSVTPLLVADVLFKAYLEWNAASGEYVGRINGPDWNLESEKLRSGVETMNALHAGLGEQPSGPALGIEEYAGSSPENYADVLREAEDLLHKGTISVSTASAVALASL